MLISTIDSLLRRTEPLQGVLIAAAFWTLSAIALLNLRDLHFRGMPGVQFVGAWTTMLCCLILVSLVVVRRSGSRQEPVWSVSFWRRSIGTPGLFLFAAVASHLAIGAAVLVVEENWQPDTAGSLKYRLLHFGMLVAAALGGRAVLERVGADRLLRGVLVVLIASCAVILTSPLLRELGILPPYKASFRLTGTFTNPNNAGLVACMTVALALAFLTNGGSRKLGYPGLVVGTAATLATASRTAFFMVVAILILFALLNLRDRRKAVFLLYWVGGVIGVTVVAILMTPWIWLRDAEDHKSLLVCESPSDGHSNADADCAVLLAVKDVLAGDQPLNWHRALPVNLWEGVTVDSLRGRVTHLLLKERGLNGRIPPELGRLRELVRLSLDRNRLTGPIPPELGNLANLKYLNLNSNLLSGAIPPELARLSSLGKLALLGNRLTGPVPPQLGEIESLYLVRLAGNGLDRPFPPGVRELSDQAIDDELFCRRSPRMPPGLLGDCTLLLATRDEIAGEARLNWREDVPIGWWQGVSLGGPEGRVRTLALPKLGLTGRIPPELGRLHGLVSLHLARNRLTGPIPSELGQLAKLRELILDFNVLTGGIPTELGRLAKLENLWLGSNDLTGPVPPELFDVATHDLAQFTFCRSPPQTSPGLFTDCTTLLAARETLGGDARLKWHEAVPISEWQGVVLGGPEGRVIALELPRIGLTGRIPAALGSLAHLQTLVLDGNELTGAIPPEIGNLTDLQVLSLAANNLSGPVPTELEKLSNLQELWLDDNRLSGPIPPELDAIAAHSLRIARNDIFSVVMFAMDGPDRGVLFGNLGAALENQRLLLWRLGFEKATEAPLFGQGLGTMLRLDSSIEKLGRPLGVHNLYLTLLGEAGIVPPLLLVLSLTLLLRSQWTAPKSIARDASMSWIIFIALRGMTSEYLFIVAAVMFLAGLCVAMSAARDESAPTHP